MEGLPGRREECGKKKIFTREGKIFIV